MWYTVIGESTINMYNNNNNVIHNGNNIAMYPESQCGEDVVVCNTENDINEQRRR